VQLTIGDLMAKKVLEAPGLDDAFATELAESGLSDFFIKVLDRDDMSVDVLTTGLPRLDKILHAKKLGLPKGRCIEVFSRDPEVGKTSLALQIGAHWQSLGQKVAIVDVEDTITADYLIELGYTLDPAPGSNVYPPYLAKGFNSDTGEVLSAEEITDSVGKISKIVDLVIIDSIGALAKRADLEKEPGDSTMGGIGKILWEYFRKNTHTKATAVWINQALPQIGVFSPNGIKYKTSGGNSIPFHSTIRMELRLVEKLKDKNDQVYGVVIDVHTMKNKVSPPLRNVKLTYLNGEGFSSAWDLFQSAIENKVIEKSGSWFSFAGERLGQGELNSYNLFRSNPELKERIAKALNTILEDESKTRQA
jgi:recombination protein RecA